MEPVFKSSTGWRRRGQAMLLGVFASAALPPFYLLPLLWPAFMGLFLLVHYAPTRRQAFLDGWWWGLGHFAAGLYWICISLYVDPAKFAWLTPFALFGLPAVLAIYTGLVTLGLFYARRRPLTQRILVFALLWVAAEFLRSTLFSGFPWNLIGYVWTVSDTTMQLASVCGVYGLGWLTVLWATLPVMFVLRERVWPALSVGVMLFALMIAFGAGRLAAHPTAYTNVTLRVVQADIPESMKWDAKTLMQGLQKHVALTRRPGLERVDAVVWPETAVPYFVQPDSALARDLGAMLPAKAVLLTGGLRGVGDEKHWQAWNSLFAVDHDGRILAQYDKHHLVPFGEYIPLRWLLPLDNIAGGIGDFSRGPGAATLEAAHLPPFSPLICYEAIFPGRATDGSGRARWLLNITNDAWFGISSGPYQHLQMARLRAVEEGLPLVRAANTGISALFDPYGRTLARLSLGHDGIFDVLLPVSATHPPIVSRYPYAGILFIIVFTLIFIVSAPKQRC